MDLSETTVPKLAGLRYSGDNAPGQATGFSSSPNVYGTPRQSLHPSLTSCDIDPAVLTFRPTERVLVFPGGGERKIS